MLINYPWSTGNGIININLPITCQCYLVYIELFHLHCGVVFVQVLTLATTQLTFAEQRQQLVNAWYSRLHFLVCPHYPIIAACFLDTNEILIHL